MGLLNRLARWVYDRTSDPSGDEALWNSWGCSVPTAAGVQVNQQTALNASAVMACVTMLAEDVAKITPNLFRVDGSGKRALAKDHFLHELLWRPNAWQSGLEFRETLMLSLVMRGNAYAVIIRNRRGDPIRFVPINADRVSLWESPDGDLFYPVTPLGLHERAQLAGEPFMIPAEDMLHIRGFSVNGLLAASRIVLAKEAIGLFLAQEQTAARWAGNGQKLNGVLTTDAKLNSETASRLAQDWKNAYTGVQNAGKVAVLEQGLKFQPISLGAKDMEFIASRQFQLTEVARIFRVPPHMIGDLSRATNNNISQQSQEYANYTLTGYTERISAKIDTQFDLRSQGLVLDWDFSVLTRADLPTRFNSYRTAIMSMFMTSNEARRREGLDPVEGGDKLYQPVNMAELGSNLTGEGAPGGGRPEGSESGAGGVPMGNV